MLQRFSDANDIPFPLLADEGSRVIKAFKLHFQDGLPHPGTVVVDQQGVVRVKLFEEGYRRRHTAEALLGAAETLGQ